MKPREIIKEDAQTLFSRATEIARNKETIFCCPIGITTICKTNPPCRHCEWRSKAKVNPFYWRDISEMEIAESAKQNALEGTHRIYMPSGWAGFDLPDRFYESVRIVRQNINAEIYGFSGPVSKESLKNLKSAGMNGYWCGLEMPNRELFNKIRPGDDFDARIKTLEYAKDLGLKTWSGFVFGVGENEEDIIYGIELLQELQVDSIAIFAFNPCPDTEMEKYDRPNLYSWAKVVAVAKICNEKADILCIPELSLWAAKCGVNGFLHMYTKAIGPLPSRQELSNMRKIIYEAKPV